MYIMIIGASPDRGPFCVKKIRKLTRSIAGCLENVFLQVNHANALGVGMTNTSDFGQP